MKRLHDSFTLAALTLVSTLTLALPLQVHAQNSDVTMRSPSASPGASTTRQGTPGRSWQRPRQFGGRDANLRDGAAARPRAQQAPSSRSIYKDALIGSDPDLARPLVPCDALGSTTRGRRAVPGAYAPGNGPVGAAAGYDPATGASERLPSIPSCTSIVSSSRNADAGDRSTRAYEQLTPDVDRPGIGGRPGSLTVLRPFADD